MAHADLGTGSCEETWATGIAADGSEVTAYEACRISCPESQTARECTAAEDTAVRTCADVDGDGNADDAFICPAGGNAALSASPGDVACIESACTAAECCTVCRDDTVW